MQKLPVYLYPNSYEVIVDLDQNKGIYQIMYQRDLKIQKGLKNKIQIQFKNSDQKLLNVSSSTFVFSMFDQTDQRLMIQKNIEILDDGTTTSLKGLGQLTFTESDTLNLENNFYKFTIAQLDTDQSYTPTYANTYYTVSGNLEIRQDSFPVLKPSQEVKDFQKVYNGDNQNYEWYSGNLRAYPEFNSNSALHTLAFYMTNYIGQVIIEGTLENSPGYFGNYTLIDSLSYDKFSGIDYVNFNGVWTYIRVRYIPATEPVAMSNDITAYSGTFDKLLYRS